MTSKGQVNTFRLTRAKNGEFHVAILAAGNNKTLASTETFKRIAGAHNNMRSLIVGFQLAYAQLDYLGKTVTIRDPLLIENKCLEGVFSNLWYESKRLRKAKAKPQRSAIH